MGDWDSCLTMGLSRIWVKVVYNVSLHFRDSALSSKIHALCVLLVTVKPTSLGTLDPQRTTFYSTVQTTLYLVPSQPKMSRGGPWPRRRLGYTLCRMHSSCSTAERNTFWRVQMHAILQLLRLVVVQKQSTISSRVSSCADQERRDSSAASV